LNSKADKLTDLLSSKAEKTETEKLDNEINELEHELGEIKATLKQNSPIYSAIKNPAPFDAAKFQTNILDENSLLLEFSFGKEESYLWLVGKTEIESYVLPSREQIESHIEKLRELIDSRKILEGETTENYQARIAHDETEFEQEAQVFSNELLGQIADKIKDKRLIIVPDGKLHYFPIAALPFPNSTENQPILLTNETIYQPSAATLSLLTQIDKKPIVEPKNLLVFSDPIFSKQDPRISATSNEDQNEMSFIKKKNFRFAESLTALSRLNASREEADSIVEIVGASDSTIFTGAAATREIALDAATADYKIIHFATHGLINEERPELSGIVLSQVNENGNNQNGVVRLQDIYAMNLTADLVVLSACSTGVGKEVKGEGLMSLNNAFLQTGAKTVISSLWKVDDYATSELMKNFYRELTSGTVTTSEALRRAQIKMRQNPQYRSPFYWAAFTVQGDFQTAPKLSGSFGFWIYTFFIVPFLLSGVYAYRRRFRLFNRKFVNKN
jgi:CHAT domain-containing protein